MRANGVGLGESDRFSVGSRTGTDSVPARRRGLLRLGSHPGLQTALGQIGRILLVLALTGLLGVLMIRLAPGYDTDESDTDIRLSAETRAARRAARADDRNAFSFYLHHAQRLLKGDLGESRSLGRPVSSLLRERLPVTLRYAGAGLVCAWVLAFCWP